MSSNIFCVIYGEGSNFHNILLESDCLPLVQQLQQVEVSLNEFGSRLLNVKSLFNLFSSVSLCHIYREGNYVAHNLTKLVLDNNLAFQV